MPTTVTETEIKEILAAINPILAGRNVETVYAALVSLAVYIRRPELEGVSLKTVIDAAVEYLDALPGDPETPTNPADIAGDPA